MSKLLTEVRKIDWSSIIESSLSDATAANEIDDWALKTAIWIQQIQISAQGNAANAFLAETLEFSSQASALACCGFYRSAVAAARAIVESAMYYTYFRNHPIELSTLVRNESFYISKSDILDFHKIHTPDFMTTQARLNFLPSLEKWYKRVSAVAHGQIPGALTSTPGLANVRFDKSLFDETRGILLDAWRLVDSLFLVTLSGDLWRLFSPEAKLVLSKGLSPETRLALRIDKK